MVNADGYDSSRHGFICANSGTDPQHVAVMKRSRRVEHHQSGARSLQPMGSGPELRQPPVPVLHAN